MTTDFWTMYSWVDAIATAVPVLLFLGWVLYTDRKIVRRNAAARLKFAKSMAN